MHLHLFYELGFSPNMVTTLSIIFGILAAYFIMKGHFIIASIMWLISYYLDCVDGKLARKYNMISEFGDYYDHIGDIFKIIIIFYALFNSNPKRKTSANQKLYLIIYFIFLFLSAIHMGYQEAVYDKKNESPWLNFLKVMVTSAYDHPTQIIHVTKYFGCGTAAIVFALLIIFWRK
jgi:phosphatidylglycerophosphate synthase